ncbi:MAG: aminopeptidase [Spirochaetales bacterium]|nr:aminopeptidase [Spirochaetales bacterium]
MTRIIVLVILGVAVLALSSCYVTTQGYHLVAQQLSARPVERWEAEDDFTEGEAELFRRVEEIREYARSTLELDAGRNYTTYLRVDGDHLVDVVSAAGELSFERKEWWFPFFGRFPYKGFYRRRSAERLAARLRRDGWDVIIRPVEAFSTLGYFRDPLISFMTDYDDARLSELIIHEMAHATLWVASEAQFNEEFATFVGRTGAEDYLTARHGADSPQLVEFRARAVDSERFRSDVLALKERLDAFYRSVEGDTTERRDELLARKAAIIDEYQRDFAARYDEVYRSDRYRFFAEAAINNAYLDLFDTYTGNLPLFEKFHRRVGGGELRVTVTELVRRADAWRDIPRRARPPVLSILDE